MHAQAPAVLAFDVFGTVVDWHGSIVRELAALYPQIDGDAFALAWRAGAPHPIRAASQRPRAAMARPRAPMASSIRPIQSTRVSPIPGGLSELRAQ